MKEGITIRNYLRRFIVLIPLIVIVLVMMYFLNVFDYYETKYYAQSVDESKYVLSTIVASVDNLKEEGILYSDNKAVYNNVIGTNLSTLNSKLGLWVRLVDFDFNVVHKGVQTDPNISGENVFDRGDENYKKVTSAMRDEERGSVDFTNDKGERITIIWQLLPSPPDCKYYATVTIHEPTIVKQIQSPHLELGMLILCIVTIISVYDSVWMRIKKHNSCKDK